jgi:hypothetical protein
MRMCRSSWPPLQETLTRHHMRLTDEGERFIRLYGAVTVRRVSEGYPLAEFSAEDVAQNVGCARSGCRAAAGGKALLRQRSGCAHRPSGSGRRSGNHQRRR